jgi:hypothetical protein
LHHGRMFQSLSCSLMHGVATRGLVLLHAKFMPSSGKRRLHLVGGGILLHQYAAHQFAQGSPELILHFLTRGSSTREIREQDIKSTLIPATLLTGWFRRRSIAASTIRTTDNPVAVKLQFPILANEHLWNGSGLRASGSSKVR